MSALSGKMVTDMKKQEIKLEQIEQTIRKVLARGGEFLFIREERVCSRLSSRGGTKSHLQHFRTG